MRSKTTVLVAVLMTVCAVASASGNNHALIVEAFPAGQQDYSSPPDTALYKAFWNDPYLLFELLDTAVYGHRFNLSAIPAQRIHLLYADGSDYDHLSSRYDPSRLGLTKATDASATLDTVCRYLEAFAYGDQSLGIDALTYDDTLMVYLFGHGGHDSGSRAAPSREAGDA